MKQTNEEKSSEKVKRNKEAKRFSTKRKRNREKTTLHKFSSKVLIYDSQN